MKIEVSEHIFEKAQISDFITIRPVAAELFHADGRTDGDRGDETNSRFSQLCEHA